MRKIGLATILVLAIGVAVQAQTQNCTCLSTPFTPNPPCFKECGLNLLESVSVEQLRSMLGTSSSTAAKVIAQRNKGARTLEDYQAVLTPEEFSTLVTKMNSLRPDQLREIQGTRSEELTPNPREPGIRPLPNDLPITDSAEVKPDKPDTVKGAMGAATLGGGSGPAGGGGGRPAAMPTSKPASYSNSTGYYCAKNSKGRWHWQLQIDDKHIIAKSAETFGTEQECLENIQLVKASSGAPILKR